MSFIYFLHDRAQQEYETAIKWYLKRSLSAAEGFVDAVGFALRQACSHPTRWRNAYKHYYELGLKKYPYMIIYSIEAEISTIAVWKFYHKKRHPKKKYGGLRKR